MIWLNCIWNSNDDLMEKYVREAEFFASRFDNDLNLARALYTQARAKMRKGDYVRVIDSLSIALYNFVYSGAYNYAYDCFIKINEACEALKQDCASLINEHFRSMFSNTAYIDII